MSARRALALLVIVFAGAGVSSGDGSPSIELDVRQTEGGTRVDLLTDAVLVDLVFAGADGDGERIWALLRPRGPGDPELERPGEKPRGTGPDDDDREPPCAADGVPLATLVEIVPFGEGEPGVRVVAELAARWIDAADLDGDGIDELLVGIEDRVELVDPAGEPPRRSTLLADPALADGRPVVLGRHGGSGWLRVAGLGSDRYLTFDAATGGYVERTTIDNRTHVVSAGDGLSIWSPPVVQVPDGPDGPDSPGPLLAVWPRFEGGDRVQVDLVRPDAADVEARRVSCWGALPGEERPVEQAVRLLDGEPVAIVTTVPVGGLNLFGEKRLRVIPLRRDRSRRGVSPLLAIETRVNVWQEVEPVLHDVDDDGGTDLVLAYWKGLKDDRVVLDTYLRDRAGGFSPRPKTTAFDVKDGDRSYLIYGEDATGDGRPDLVLTGEQAVRLHEGTDDPRRAVRRAPVASVPIADVCGGQMQIAVSADGSTVRNGGSIAPRAVDLDGDGRVELVIRRDGCAGPRLQFVRFAIADDD